ncbi:MAG TPA: hypothetical protein DCL41_06490 [Bdellovibrionales bacterium]|nr:hypothetical protein [Pseudobdellovibrionaceae bacterium]HAG91499.1 hypothetical protein [Bdellovibrionales bacterium]|tara:strand:+ start:369 stop:770 length:402 start_codon:yes stop_codon:yes gene_type:complete
MKKFFQICLWTQVFAFLFATVMFAGLGNPRLAGSLTGPVFLLTGALPFLGILARRTHWTQFSFWWSLLFTLTFSGPMLWKRFLMYGQNFSEITYFGMSSAHFHRLSSIAFLILFFTLLLDLYRIRKAQKKPTE